MKTGSSERDLNAVINEPDDRFTEVAIVMVRRRAIARATTSFPATDNAVWLVSPGLIRRDACEIVKLGSRKILLRDAIFSKFLSPALFPFERLNFWSNESFRDR